MTGLVRSYDATKGYGFIQPLIGKPKETPDLFFHISQCIGGFVPPKGAQVSFTLVRGVQGPQAAGITLVRQSSKVLASGIQRKETTQVQPSTDANLARA